MTVKVHNVTRNGLIMKNLIVFHNSHLPRHFVAICTYSTSQTYDSQLLAFQRPFSHTSISTEVTIKLIACNQHEHFLGSLIVISFCTWIRHDEPVICFEPRLRRRKEVNQRKMDCFFITETILTNDIFPFLCVCHNQVLALNWRFKYACVVLVYAHTNESV